ncbi:MAG: phenylalanine--tRNA ligase subunit alpha, partial [Campylobacteraceae bacterium]|nr:phenylalanine--tRNA ligase subunit alpha [Campylobacteraceae bacterium]
MKDIEKSVTSCTSLVELEKIRVSLFGKKGYFAAQFNELKDLEGEAKKVFAQNLNTNKENFLALLSQKKMVLEEVMIKE